MNFKNRPNQQVWISRAVAVLAIPLFQYKCKAWVPLGRRAQGLQYAGQWGLPCGYLDWDETAPDAVRREVYEELGLDLQEFENVLQGSLDQPYFVFSDPLGDVHQNVTLRFACLIRLSAGLPDLRASGETPDVAWFSLDDGIDLPLAFNHADILREVKGLFKL